MEELTLFDYIVLGVAAFGLITGLVRGFSTMALNFAAWIGAALITLYAFQPAADYMRTLIEAPAVADIVALVLLFLVSLIVLRLIANMIGSGIRSSPVGFLDRSLGALAGLAIGGVSICLLYLLLTLAVDREDQPDWIAQAQLQPLVAYGADLLASIGPDLWDRARDQEGSRRALERMRETVPQFERNAEELLERGYDDIERRALREAIERSLRCDPEQDPDCEAQRR
ncbi:MAG: CvpA family protein [Rhodothalassiaceae bacterium]